MAANDSNDYTSQILALLPRIWFSDAARRLGGNLFAVVSGMGALLAYLWTALRTLSANARLLTTQDVTVLQAIASDLFGGALPLLAGESLEPYRARILAHLFLPGGTREGLRRAVFSLTGTNPTLIEPWNPSDTGTYDTGYWGYDQGGAWGQQDLPWVGFVRVQRPITLANGGRPFSFVYDGGYTGYDSSASAYVDPQAIQTIPDATILKAINDAKAYGTTVGVLLQ
jgi:hypothetical protein